MKKTNTWLALLLGAQVVFFGLLYAVCGGSERTEAVHRLLFAGLQRDKLDRILVEEAVGKSLELALKDGEWKLPGKNDFPADQKKVERILGQLLGLESVYLVSRDPAYHYEYEVAADKYRRRVTLDGGGQKKVLLIGKAGGTGYTQVRMDDEPEVWAVEDLKYWELGTQVADWARKEVVDEPAARLAKLELEKGGEHYLLERTDQSAWKLGEKAAQKSEADSLATKATRIELADVAGLASDEELKKKIEAGTESVNVKLLLASDALPESSQPPQPAADGGSQTAAPPAPPTINQTVSFRLVKDPEKDSQAYFLKEGWPFVAKVDMWRVRPLFDLTREKLEQK